MAGAKDATVGEGLVPSSSLVTEKFRVNAGGNVAESLVGSSSFSTE
jgi:hypothetical protein